LKNRSFFEWLYIIAVFAISAFVWWKLWVEPRDEFLSSIIDCQNESGDHSFEGYEQCKQEVANEL